MMVSTRGRYALRVIIDLAENGNDGYIPMREVASRQDISLKYLERCWYPKTWSRAFTAKAADTASQKIPLR